MSDARDNTTRRTSVLQLGFVQDNFVLPLVEQLARHRPCLGFSVLGLHSQDAEVRDIPKAVDAVFTVPARAREASMLEVLHRMLSCSVPSGRREWAGDVLAELLEGKAASRAIKAASLNLLRSADVLASDRSWGRGTFGIYHFHTMFKKVLHVVPAIPPEAKLVVSIWGSDLLRSHGIPLYRRQQQLLKRADLITVQTSEVGEILLAKFGREHEPRLRFAKFGSSLLDEIDFVSREDARRMLFGRLAIQGEVIVAVGRNGSRIYRHIDILNSLAKLVSCGLRNFSVVVPATYGQDTVYLQELKRAVDRFPGECRLITEFLSPTELAALRRAADVYIDLPVSDALGASIGEAIYAGSVAVIGSWLPYAQVKDRYNVYLRTVNSIEQLPVLLEDILDHLETEKSKVRATAQNVRAIAGWDQTLPAWLAVYDELVESIK